MVQVESRLKEALDAAEDSELIDVVIAVDLPPLENAEVTPFLKLRKLRAAQAKSALDHAIHKAGETAQCEPENVNIMPLMGTAYLRAQKSLVKALIDTAEIQKIVLNKTVQT